MSASNRAPYLKVQGFTEVAPTVGLTRELFIAGRVDNGGSPTGGLSYYEPLRIGQVTSQGQAAALCDTYGLAVAWTDQNTLDLANTDELAALLITAAQEYQRFIARNGRYTLTPCNITIGALEDTCTATADPYGDTAVDDLLTNSINTPIDIFVAPYELTNATEAAAGGFFDVQKTWLEARIATNNIDLGDNWSVFANVSDNPVGAVAATLPETDYEYSTNISFPCTNSYFQPTAGIAAVCVAVQMLGMQAPFYGRFEVSLPVLPTPDDRVEYISFTTANSLFEIGWSPIMTNFRSGALYTSRFVSGMVTDPVTSITRDFYYDYQSYRAFFYSQKLLRDLLQSSGIINDKFTVNSSGEAPILTRAIQIAKQIDVRMFNDGMVAVDPTLYSDEYSAKLSTDNTNLIIIEKPFYVSPIIYQILATSTVKNFTPLIREFNILV